MSEHPSYESWSIEKIHSYLLETMSLEDRERFDAQLTHDPMLRDALDGFAAHAKIHADHHYQQLLDRIGASQVGTAVIGPWAWKVAASLLLIGIIGGAAMYMVPRWMQSENTMTASDDRRRSPQTEVIQNDSRRVSTAEDMVLAASASIDSPYADRSQDSLIDGQVSIAYSVQDLDDSDGTPTSNSANRSPRRRKASAVQGGVLRGYVTDGDDVAVEGASIYLPHNEVLVKTDETGGFAVDLKNVDTTMVVKQAGYLTWSGPVSFDKVNTVVLNEDEAWLAAKAQAIQDSLMAAQAMSAPETAVAATAEPVTEQRRIRYGSARPERGLRKYARYVKREMNYPTAAKLEKVQGQVILQFSVRADGTLYDIEVIQGLGYGCDAEAKRLLMQGPEWIIEGDAEVGRASYTFQFKL